VNAGKKGSALIHPVFSESCERSLILYVQCIENGYSTITSFMRQSGFWDRGWATSCHYQKML